MLNYYRLATHILTPFVPLWLQFRQLKGKEERGRIKERYGHSSYARPHGTLLWIHAASVGEANSVLALIQQLRSRFPALHILLTTGTVTSAALMKERLPEGVLHHYAPVDTPEATSRFIKHWLPDVVWFVESELWPNLIDAAKEYHCLMALINARMSERSFYFWQKYQHVAEEMLSAFQVCFAQSEGDATRLRALGAKEVLTKGNLKYDAPLLTCNEAELLTLGNQLKGRALWLAASTHPQEEKIIAKAATILKKQHPNLLTIIVPRHAHRGKELAEELSGYGRCALRSAKTPLDNTIDFYIADTMGELGLFYRLSPIVFMGGSLIKHGGQNPLEAAKLSCAIITGSYVYNFADMYQDMIATQSAFMAHNEEELAKHVHHLILSPDACHDIQDRAREFAEKKQGPSQFILELFSPVFTHENT